MADHNKKVVKPANSFMLFRSDFMRNNIPTAEQKDQGNVSKLAKEKWDYIKKNKPEEYEYWVQKAKQLAVIHREQNPDYVYKAPGRRVRESQFSGTVMDTEGSSASGKSSSPSSSSVPQPPRLAQSYQHQQYLTPDSFTQSPTPSSSTTKSPDDFLFDGEELDIDVGSYDSIVTMLDFHERGITKPMARIDEDFFQ